MTLLKMRLVLIALAVLLWTSAVQAQTVGQYLEGTSDAAVRVEITDLLPEVEETLGGKILQWLRISKQARVRPPVGTKFTVQSSAYASSPYQTDSTPCITAAGTRVRPGVVASNFLPLGTILEIRGEVFIVEDRMNARYAGYFIDLWFPSTFEALQFGRRNLEIVIVGYGDPGQEIRAAAEPVGEGLRPLPTEEPPTLLERVRSRLVQIVPLLSTRSAAEANKYDVDCLK